jgi:diketogulonate reductase-like aldo/keto reductase
MKYLTLRDGTKIPKLGQGTWHMGDDPKRMPDECDALKAGIEHGMTLIDSAEMYGGGRAESLVGKVVPEYPREMLTLVSKVYPHHAGRDHIFDCCDASIRRMGAEYLDLYLLHWRGAIPLSETVECMEELVRRGKIRHWGVSNFDVDDMEELFRVKGGENCAVNQVLYHLGSRGVEYDLLPWLERHRVPLMAYCPLAQAGTLRSGLLTNQTVREIAKEHHAVPAQILLAFLMSKSNVFAIPKAGSKKHTLENAAAVDIVFSPEEAARLDEAFPPPGHKMFLDIV